jgi:antitoxin HicB
MLQYPIKLKKDTNSSVLVTFPDIPEAATSVHDHADVMIEATAALESALEFYFDDHRAVPMPSLPKRGQQTLMLTASMSAKVLLLNEMLKQNVRPADLARLLGTSAQAVNRLTNLRHSTKIDGIVEAFQVLGKRLELRVA